MSFGFKRAVADFGALWTAVTWPLAACPQLGGLKWQHGLGLGCAVTVDTGLFGDYLQQALLKHWDAGWGMQQHPSRAAADVLCKSAVSCDLLWAQSQQTSSKISRQNSQHGCSSSAVTASNDQGA